jgi:hypothetical protein
MPEIIIRILYSVRGIKKEGRQEIIPAFPSEFWTDFIILRQGLIFEDRV